MRLLAVTAWQEPLLITVLFCGTVLIGFLLAKKYKKK